MIYDANWPHGQVDMMHSILAIRFYMCKGNIKTFNQGLAINQSVSGMRFSQTNNQIQLGFIKTSNWINNKK